DSGLLPLDAAPLFETVADLAAAPNVMRELLAEPYYRAHLAGRGMHQMVMIGYSDSNKDAGIGASRWALQRAQAMLVETTDRAGGVDLTFFHGRGGTVSRGGGKITSAILSAPAGSVRGRFRMTEQGEVINAKYGLRGIAMRTLEQTVSAVALATALPPPRAPDARETDWSGIMDATALDRAAERYGAKLDDMMRDWPFLRALIDDVEMVLGTADFAIAARYARLAGKLGERYFPVIRAEFDRTVANVLALKHEAALLDSDPALQR